MLPGRRRGKWRVRGQFEREEKRRGGEEEGREVPKRSLLAEYERNLVYYKKMQRQTMNGTE
jgi:hypothetical protein